MRSGALRRRAAKRVREAEGPPSASPRRRRAAPRGWGTREDAGRSVASVERADEPFAALGGVDAGGAGAAARRGAASGASPAAAAADVLRLDVGGNGRRERCGLDPYARVLALGDHDGAGIARVDELLRCLTARNH